MLKTMFCQYSWTQLFFPCQTTRKLAFSQVVSLIQCNTAQYDKFCFQIFSTYNRLQPEIPLILFWRPLLGISLCIRTVCTCILQCLQELTNSCYQIVSLEFYFLYIPCTRLFHTSQNAVYVTLSKELAKHLYLNNRSMRQMTNAVS